MFDSIVGDGGRRLTHGVLASLKLAHVIFGERSPACDVELPLDQTRVGGLVRGDCGSKDTDSKDTEWIGRRQFGMMSDLSELKARTIAQGSVHLCWVRRI